MGRTSSPDSALWFILVETECLKEDTFMKMFVFVYADYFEGTATTTFKQAGYDSYISFHNMTSKYEGLEPRTKGPGSNGGTKALWIPVPDEKASQLIDIVRNLRKEYPTVGFGAFTFQLEEFVV
jgi:hypothetical protein